MGNKSLYHLAFKICSTKSLLNNQIEIIKSLIMSWNGCPKSIQNFLMKELKTKYSDSSTSVTVNKDTVDNLPKIWILHSLSLQPWRFPFKIMCEQSAKISF